LKPLLLDAVLGLTLCKCQDSISKAGMDLLVLTEVLRRRVGGSAEADALMNNFAGDLIGGEILGR